MTVIKRLLSMFEMVAGNANAFKELKVNFSSVCPWAMIYTGRVSRYIVN